MKKPDAYVAHKFSADTIEEEKANRRSAKAYCRHLARFGFFPHNPVTQFGLPTPTEIKQNDQITIAWQECMVRCLRTMIDCDVLFLSPGWRRSKGCLYERSVWEYMKTGEPVLYSLAEAKEFIQNYKHPQNNVREKS